jgi:transketolase
MTNMLIAEPGAPAETRACLRYLIANPQPSYLRIGKAGEPVLHQDVPELLAGHWVPLRSAQRDSGKVLLTTGATLPLAVELQRRNEYQDFSVCSLPLWGMKSKALQHAQLARMKEIITVEDHLSDAGFGSWLLESVANDIGIRGRIRSISLGSNICGLVGSQKTLNAAGGLE